MLSINIFTVVTIISIAVAAAYVFIMVKYIKTWRILPDWNLPVNFTPNTKVSIIVPARNEAENITACLLALSKLNYPKELFEVIVMDDHSEDNTFDLALNFAKKHLNFRALKLENNLPNDISDSYKKMAIEAAISISTGELIVTTDADCIPQPDWLMLLVSFYEKCEWQFIAAPVNFHKEESLLEKFQSLDFLGMMGATAAGLHLNWTYMCNGANLAYSKNAFNEVGGFRGIDHIASGDDMLLMQKMAAHFPDRIGFLKNKNAAVFTNAKPDIKSFFSQRMRWATKTSSHLAWKTTLILTIAFLHCCSILLALLSTPIWGVSSLALFSILLFLKSLTDYFFLKEMARYFGRSDLMKSYWSSQAIHILYIILVGSWSNVKKQYPWKGRMVK